MSIYFPPSLQKFEPKRMVLSTWVDHVAFAYDLVECLRPKVVVELGAHNGLSFFTFCQSMKENDVDGMCYAVDTWAGDEHTGDYGSSVFDDVRDYAREEYSGISYLMQMLFNEALNHFSDESIDLLHIDGLHTYEAVREDFDNWYPKVRPGGIILFHDIEARMKDYGVWKFWEELQTEHETFHFLHGFGLGVLRKPGGQREPRQLLELLFTSVPEDRKKLRQLYAHASHHASKKSQARRIKARRMAEREREQSGN